MTKIRVLLLIILSGCSHPTDESEMNKFHKTHERFDKLNRELEAGHR